MGWNEEPGAGEARVDSPGSTRVVTGGREEHQSLRRTDHGSKVQGVQEASRSWKEQGNGLSCAASRRRAILRTPRPALRERGPEPRGREASGPHGATSQPDAHSAASAPWVPTVHPHRRVRRGYSRAERQTKKSPALMGTRIHYLIEHIMKWQVIRSLTKRQVTYWRDRVWSQS